MEMGWEQLGYVGTKSQSPELPRLRQKGALWPQQPPPAGRPEPTYHSLSEGHAAVVFTDSERKLAATPSAFPPQRAGHAHIGEWHLSRYISCLVSTPEGILEKHPEPTTVSLLQGWQGTLLLLSFHQVDPVLWLSRPWPRGWVVLLHKAAQ